MPDAADEPDARRPEPAAGATPDEAGGDPDTLRLFEEQISVDTARSETGRVRVKVMTRMREEAVEVPLTQERYEIEHVPIGREIETIPPRRQEGDVTIIPVVEEVIVMRRKLVLKEEVHLRLVRTTEQHRENVVLRRQEAVVERLPVGQLSTE